jgi:hypothetical protein
VAAKRSQTLLPQRLVDLLREHTTAGIGSRPELLRLIHDRRPGRQRSHGAMGEVTLAVRMGEQELARSNLSRAGVPCVCDCMTFSGPSGSERHA